MPLNTEFIGLLVNREDNSRSCSEDKTEKHEGFAAFFVFCIGIFPWFTRQRYSDFSHLYNHLFKVHLTHLWSLYMAGFLREAFRFEDSKGSIFIVEAESINQAKEKVAQLPLALHSLCSYDFICLGPYRTWERISNNRGEEMREALGKPVELLSREKLRPIWFMGTFNSNFTNEAFQKSVEEQALDTFRYFKAGIFQELYVMQRPLVVSAKMSARDVEEASQYLEALPYFRLELIDCELIPLAIFDFWELIFLQD
ncbi:hypothetical protein G9A89_016932 [Geosiphon pyriformis]|nr:hypothetical protein G9A89_016932 [Geosiphon pyriformis]